MKGVHKEQLLVATGIGLKLSYRYRFPVSHKVHRNRKFVKLFQTSRTVETLISLLDYHLLELLYCKGKSSTQTPNLIYPMKSDFNPIRKSLCEYVTFTVSKG